MFTVRCGAIKRVVKTLVSTLCGVCGLLIQMGCNTETQRLPQGVECFTDSQRYEVVVGGHRLQKHVYLEEEDEKALKERQREPSYVIVTLTKLKSGDIVAPLVQVKEGRRGSMGRSFQVDTWRRVDWVIAAGQTYIDLPIDERIDHYLFIIRSPGEDVGESHIHQMDAAELRQTGNQTLSVPGVSELALLKDKENSQDTVELISVAQEARKGLRENE